MPIRRIHLLLVVAMLASPCLARAHFVWIVTAPEASGQVSARVSFSERPGAGEPHLLDRMRRLEIWQRTSATETAEVRLRPWQDDAREQAAMVAELTARSGVVLEAVCPYGLFERGGKQLFLNYYAKHLRAPSVAVASDLARSERLQLDIVPRFAGEQVELQVLWGSAPLADCELQVESPDGTTHELKTNAQGQVELPWTRGAYSARARFVEADRGGEVDGKPYSETWHIATLTWELAAVDASQVAVALPGSDHDVDPSGLLRAAREHRAVWQDFPGFRARLHVELDGQSAQGSLVVSSDGEVEVRGLEALQEPLIDQQFNSLVSHRLPDGEVEGEAVLDPEHPGRHALGRRILLEGNAMGSAYRIRDNVVREVERKIGRDGMFAIDVLEVEWNRDGKYLPRVFAVNTWMGPEGKLQSSLLIRQEWLRLGAFDLPLKLELLRADGEGRRVICCRLSDHELAAAE